MSEPEKRERLSPHLMDRVVRLWDYEGPEDLVWDREAGIGLRCWWRPSVLSLRWPGPRQGLGFIDGISGIGSAKRPCTC